MRFLITTTFLFLSYAVAFGCSHGSTSKLRWVAAFGAGLVAPYVVLIPLYSSFYSPLNLSYTKNALEWTTIGVPILIVGSLMGVIHGVKYLNFIEERKQRILLVTKVFAWASVVMIFLFYISVGKIEQEKHNTEDETKIKITNFPVEKENIIPPRQEYKEVVNEITDVPEHSKEVVSGYEKVNSNLVTARIRMDKYRDYIFVDLANKNRVSISNIQIELKTVTEDGKGVSLIYGKSIELDAWGERMGAIKIQRGENWSKLTSDYTILVKSAG